MGTEARYDSQIRYLTRRATQWSKAARGRESVDSSQREPDRPPSFHLVNRLLFQLYWCFKSFPSTKQLSKLHQRESLHRGEAQHLCSAVQRCSVAAANTNGALWLTRIAPCKIEVTVWLLWWQQWEMNKGKTSTVLWKFFGAGVHTQTAASHRTMRFSRADHRGCSAGAFLQVRQIPGSQLEWNIACRFMTKCYQMHSFRLAESHFAAGFIDFSWLQSALDAALSSLLCSL